MPEVTIKKSFNMHQTGYNQKAAKMEGNTEGRVEQRKFLAHRGWATIRGLRKWTAMLRVVLGLGNRPMRVAYGADPFSPSPPDRFIMRRLNG